MSAFSSTSFLPESEFLMNLVGFGLNQLFDLEVCFKALAILSLFPSFGA
jgi:hypothetical protein